MTISGFRCDIYNDTSGLPGTSQANTETITAVPTNLPNMVEFTGLSYAMTDGVPIWFVLKNVQGTPASNYFSPMFSGGSGAGPLTQAAWNPIYASTNSGSTWVAGSYQSIMPPMRLQFSDGSYDGIPYTAVGNDTSHGAYGGTNEVGLAFTSPANGYLQISGAWMEITSTGTPAGNVSYKLYNAVNSSSPTLLGQTNAYAYGSQSELFTPLYFPASSPDLIVPPLTPLYLTIACSGGSSGNMYEIMTMSWLSDTNSQALKPFNGTLEEVYLASSTWTKVATQVPVGGLICNAYSPFNPTYTPFNHFRGNY
jgi:hypothetical protein